MRLRLPEPVWTRRRARRREALAAARAAARTAQWHAHAQPTRRRRSTSSAAGFLAGAEEEWVHERRRELEELELEALEWIARSALATGHRRPGRRPAREPRAGRPLAVPRDRSPVPHGGARREGQRRRGAPGLRRAARPAARRARHRARGRASRRCTGGCCPGSTPRSGRSPGTRPAVSLPRQLAPRERSAFVARDPRAGRPARRLGTRPAAASGGWCSGGRAGHRQDAAGQGVRARGAPRRHGARRGLPGGGARLLPALRGGGAQRRARPGAGRAHPGRGRARPHDPRAPRGAGSAVRRCRDAAVPALRGDVGAAGRARLAGAARARDRRPPLGRPRHPAAAPPRRPRPARGGAADRRHLPRRRGRGRRTRSPTCWRTCAATDRSSA